MQYGVRQELDTSAKTAAYIVYQSIIASIGVAVALLFLLGGYWVCSLSFTS
jgi:hypothetical protein